ncbi:DUF494 family protein [Legionella shakespearei]|uniref:Protein Smg n=1 Tax=Legionella shakespearei DSM 23087 TaxID=1122169 RepID=A0A0W0Z877_9GAMM|nr:DUF494 family protein [Legionella shakespearei]KTD65118.1 Protein Smg [Legionella shakespearei DSM 23087]
MKDNLFEMLLNLFEKSLTQLQKSHKSNEQDSQEFIDEEDMLYTDDQSLYIKPAQHNSIRVFTYDEQMKLTKASYQFLMRMKLWKIVDSDVLETILNQLQNSESRIVTLQETKWTIRNVLENNFNEEQLAFLDLVLYQTEDALSVH